eukprot:4356824-Amphidinium_carterae.1
MFQDIVTSTGWCATQLWQQSSVEAQATGASNESANKLTLTYSFSLLHFALGLRDIANCVRIGVLHTISYHDSYV